MARSTSALSNAAAGINSGYCIGLASILVAAVTSASYGLMQLQPDLVEDGSSWSDSVALERGPFPSDWASQQLDRSGRPVLQPAAQQLWFGEQVYSVHPRSGVLEPGRYDRLPATGGALRLVSGDYRVQTLNMAGAEFDVDTSAGNVWLEVQDAAVPISSAGAYTHRVDSGAELVLGPGASGSIFAAPGGTVRITAGAYSFDSVVLAEGSRFVADESEGDVLLSVRGTLVAEQGVQLEFVGGATFLVESLDSVGRSSPQQLKLTPPRGAAPSGGGGGGGGVSPLQDILNDLAEQQGDDPVTEDDVLDETEDIDDVIENETEVPAPGASSVFLLGMLAAARRRR